MYEQNSFMLLNLGRRELTYGAGVASGVEEWYKFTGPGLFKSNLEEDTDETEIKGSRYPTVSTLVSARTSGEFTFKMNLELLPFFLGLICGNLEKSGETPTFTHTIDSPGVAAVSPWSTALIQAQDRGATTSFKSYNGIVITALEFEISDAGAIEVKVTAKGDGSEVDASTTPPPDLVTALPGTRLFKEHISALSFGPSGSPVDLLATALLRKLSLKLDAGVTQKDSLVSGLYAGEVYYDGNGPVLTGELTVKGKLGDAFYNAVRLRTLETYSLTIQTGATASFNTAGNAVRIPADAGVTPDYDESGPILTIPLRFDYHTTDLRAFRFIVINGIETYLATA